MARLNSILANMTVAVAEHPFITAAATWGLIGGTIGAIRAPSGHRLGGFARGALEGAAFGGAAQLAYRGLSRLYFKNNPAKYEAFIDNTYRDASAAWGDDTARRIEDAVRRFYGPTT